jgi:ribose 5-phosphate isomerase A
MEALDQRTRYKQQAAEHAVGFVESGMILGLGTGSTAIFVTRKVAELLKQGTLRDIVAVATSRAVWSEAERLGIPMLDPGIPSEIDLTIDGADEVDPRMNLIKGGGGAFLWEKIVAQNSRRVTIVVDDSKLSAELGTRCPVPVEVIEFGLQSHMRYLRNLRCKPVLREVEPHHPYTTDSGNRIIDCSFGPITDPHTLAHALEGRAGILEHGLFLGIATDLVSSGEGGIKHITRAELAPNKAEV